VVETKQRDGLANAAAWISVAYGPVAVAATAFAIVGHLMDWHFAEAPLVVLTLPYSIVPLWLHVGFVPLLVACVAVAAVLWSRMTHVHGRTPQTAPGRVVALCVLWVGVGLGAAGMLSYDHWYGPWPALRHSVADFEVPAGFTRVATIEAGSEACVISCSSPRIAVVLTTSLSPSEACATIESEVNQVAEDVRRSSPPKAIIQEASCFMRGDLPTAGSDATLTAAVLRGEDLQPYSYLLANGNTPHFDPDDTVVTLVFNTHHRLELDRPLDIR
jgi:hypothetical protein